MNVWFGRVVSVVGLMWLLGTFIIYRFSMLGRTAVEMGCVFEPGGFLCLPFAEEIGRAHV